MKYITEDSIGKRRFRKNNHFSNENNRENIEKIIGRKLQKTEEIHHIDNNHSNNDLINLKIVSKSEHMKLHWLTRKGV